MLRKQQKREHSGEAPEVDEKNIEKQIRHRKNVQLVQQVIRPTAGTWSRVVAPNIDFLIKIYYYYLYVLQKKAYFFKF